MSSQTVHLLVLVHGMWGNPSHLHSLHKAIKERYNELDSAKGPGGEQLEILLAETNQEEHTYDGIDWGGERVAEEVCACTPSHRLRWTIESHNTPQTLAAVKRLEDDGKKVTRFSMTGYSLGGLVSRYAVGFVLCPT